MTYPDIELTHSDIITDPIRKRGDNTMLVGYARTSTAEQVNGFEAQIAELKREGCEKLFQEQVSSVAQSSRA